MFREVQPWFNSTYNLVMKNDERVPVSRTYAKELKKRLEFKEKAACVCIWASCFCTFKLDFFK